MIFAAEQAEREDSDPVRHAAIRRMAGWLLRTAAAAGDRLARSTLAQNIPGSPFRDVGDALAWLDAEWPAVLGTARLAASHGLGAELSVALDAAAWYFDWRCRREPLAVLRGLGSGPEAAEHLERAPRFSAGWRRGHEWPGSGASSQAFQCR
jgi:hypothetical protein